MRAPHVPTLLVLLLLLGGVAACSGAASDGAVTDVGATDVVGLAVAQEKDGDSFVASDGVEYRVGLVNTPELSECGGAQAAERAYALLADGFSAVPYATDEFDRSVSRITTPTGDLGVILAREGLADDRYLEDFRHEHPAYAEELDRQFAAAREQRAGLWSTCWATVAEATVAEGTRGGAPDRAVAEGGGIAHVGRTGSWDCHPAYGECLPDGPDLDCADVGHRVGLTGQADPYRLDGNSTTRTDGTGCDTYDPWSADVAYPYYP